MADRSTSDVNTGRNETPERTSGTATSGSRGGATQQGREAGTADRTDRERNMPTGRDVERQRGRTSQGQGTPTRTGGQGLQRQSGAISPWEGTAGSPFAMMRRMMDDMDRLFENFGFGRALAGSPWRTLDDLGDVSRSALASRGNTLWVPPLEVFERGDQLVVRADLPGLSKDDVDVEIENGVLTVSGERRQDFEDNREGLYRSERSYGTFARSIALPEGVNEEQCDATFRDGVLEITLPKPKDEQTRRRRIDVKS